MIDNQEDSDKEEAQTDNTQEPKIKIMGVTKRSELIFIFDYSNCLSDNFGVFFSCLVGVGNPFIIYKLILLAKFNSLRRTS